MKPIENRLKRELPITHAEVQTIISRHYPVLLKSVNACLAVFGSMALEGRTKPLSLMLETPSGYGKTAILQMVSPSEGDALEEYAYRSDKFTPKSFVTHASNVKRDQLGSMDLLPKLKDKVLVTKELAPLFRGREQDLQENFSILISVLDGLGFTSDSGMQGQRGYAKQILFNWLGATTPLPQSTHRMMSQLGTRLLFYEVPATPPTEDELLKYAGHDGAGTAERECRKAVGKFLQEFFENYPVGSLPQEGFHIPENFLLQLIKWARFLVAARAEIISEKIGTVWTPIAAMPPEGPWKVVNYFKDLARGHALLDDRLLIDESDIELVGQVAISSIPGHLRPIVRQLRNRKNVDTPEAMRLCRVSSPTARSYLEQLDLLGIAKVKKGIPLKNTADLATLADDYAWLRAHP